MERRRDWLKLPLLSIAVLSGSVFVIFWARIVFSPSTATEYTTILGAFFAYTTAVNVLVLKSILRDLPRQIDHLRSNIVSILVAAGETKYAKFSNSLRENLKELLKPKS